jgi:hypothetical protein
MKSVKIIPAIDALQLNPDFEFELGSQFHAHLLPKKMFRFSGIKCILKHKG